MSGQLIIGQLSDRGKVREINEDNLCVLTPPSVASGIDALLAVMDGIGGHQAGEVASRFVAEQLKKLFSPDKFREWVMYSPDNPDYYLFALKEAIERLSDELNQKASTSTQLFRMGTTATIALFAQGQVHLGHVGDSRAYLFHAGALQQLTKDHSWVMEQVELGVLTAAQAAVDPRRNQITRALGLANTVKVDLRRELFGANDAVLLCSDGLSTLVSNAEIVEHLQTISDPQRVCEKLVELANTRGGNDNITVILARSARDAAMDETQRLDVAKDEATQIVGAKVDASDDTPVLSRHGLTQVMTQMVGKSKKKKK